MIMAGESRKEKLLQIESNSFVSDLRIILSLVLALLRSILFF